MSATFISFSTTNSHVIASTDRELALALFWRTAVRKPVGKVNPPSQNTLGICLFVCEMRGRRQQIFRGNSQKAEQDQHDNDAPRSRTAGATKTTNSKRISIINNQTTWKCWITMVIFRTSTDGSTMDKSRTTDELTLPPSHGIARHAV